MGNCLPDPPASRVELRQTEIPAEKPSHCLVIHAVALGSKDSHFWIFHSSSTHGYGPERAKKELLDKDETVVSKYMSCEFFSTAVLFLQGTVLEGLTHVPSTSVRITPRESAATAFMPCCICPERGDSKGAADTCSAAEPLDLCDIRSQHSMSPYS